jgi:hypothetical protein
MRRTPLLTSAQVKPFCGVRWVGFWLLLLVPLGYLPALIAPPPSPSPVTWRRLFLIVAAVVLALVSVLIFGRSTCPAPGCIAPDLPLYIPDKPPRRPSVDWDAILAKLPRSFTTEDLAKATPALKGNPLARNIALAR